MKRKTNKRLSLALSMIMAITSINIASPLSYAQKDIQNHWAKETLTKWQQNGYIKGDEKGNLNPDKSITRAEFITIINKAMGYSKQGEKIKSYTDVKEKDWYYKEIMTALEQGYISGTGENKISPNSKITRQEVMVIINKIANIKNQENFDITKVKDHKKIATWANTSAINMISNGYIAGYDGNINPEKEMKRAEAIVLIDAYKENNRTLSFEGQYNLSQANKVTILTGNIKIKDSKINELIISEKAKGKIELEKVEITGKTTNNSKEAELYLNGEKVQIKDGKIEKTNDKEQEAKYKDGQYEGKASGYGGDIKVKVTIKDGKIEKIEVVEQKEDAIYWNAAKKVIDRIIEKQDTQVDASAGATISSKGIMFAVEDALKKAENKKEEVKPKENYKDGEYIGESGGFSGTVKVKVTIKQSKIEDLEVIQHSDDEPYMQSAKNLISKIKDKQNPDVDIISGATYSSQGIINATKDALEQAKGKTQRPGQSEHALKNLSGGSSSGGTNPEIKQEQDFKDLKDGVYDAVANGHYSNSIKVRVTVSNKKITKIELIESKDDKSYFDEKKAEKIAKQIIEKQSTKGVDTISGATNSSKGFINAVVEALKQAGYITKINANFDGQGKTANEVHIAKPGITVKNLKVNDNLIITKEVADGELKLENLDIKGNLLIQGGGENSIYLKDSTIEGIITIDKEMGQRVRLVVEGKSKIKSKLQIQSPAIIQTKEDVNIPEIELSQVLNSDKETQIQAKTDKLSIKTITTKIVVKKDSNIKHIELPSIVEKYEKGKENYKKDKFELKIEKDTNINSGSNNNIVGKYTFLTKDVVESLDNNKSYADGIYYGDAFGFRTIKPVPVKITIENGKITNIERFLSEIQKLKGVPYPDKIDDGSRYDAVFDKVADIIKTKQNTLELSYKLNSLTTAAHKIMNEAEGKPQNLETYNSAFDKIIGKHTFGSNNEKLQLNSFINKTHIEHAILVLLKVYLREELKYNMEDIDIISGATFSSKGTAVAVENALKRTVPEIDIYDMRIVHNYKTQYVEGETLDFNGLEAQLYKKDGTLITIPYPEFSKNGIKVVFRNDENREIKPGISLTKENIADISTGAIELKVIHPSSFGVKLLNTLIVEPNIDVYKISKIKIKEKDVNSQWIDVKFYEELDPKGNPYNYIKKIELDKADFESLKGKKVEFKIIAKNEKSNREIELKLSNSTELTWPNIPPYGHVVDVPKDQLVVDGKNIKLFDGISLKFLLKEVKTLASEFKETPKPVVITTTAPLLTVEHVKTAFNDLSNVKNIEFEEISIEQPLEKDINVKLIFKDDSTKIFKVKIIVQENKTLAEKYQPQLRTVSVTTGPSLEIEIVKKAFVNLPDSVSSISLENPSENYLQTPGNKNIPVILEFTDNSTKKVIINIVVKDTLNKAEKYQIENPSIGIVNMILSADSASENNNKLKNVENSDNFRTNVNNILSLDSKISEYGNITLEILEEPNRIKLGDSTGKIKLSFDDNSTLELNVRVKIKPFPLLYMYQKGLMNKKEFYIGDTLNFDKITAFAAVSKFKNPDGTWSDDKREAFYIPYKDFHLFGIKVINTQTKEEIPNNSILTSSLIKNKKITLGLYREEGFEGHNEDKSNPVDIQNITLGSISSSYKKQFTDDSVRTIVDNSVYDIGDTNLSDLTENNIRVQLKLSEKENILGPIKVKLLKEANRNIFGDSSGAVELEFQDGSKLEIPVIVKAFMLNYFTVKAPTTRYSLGDTLNFDNVRVLASIVNKRDSNGNIIKKDFKGKYINYKDFHLFGLKIVKRDTKQEVPNNTLLTNDLIENGKIILDIYVEEPTLSPNIPSPSDSTERAQITSFILNK